MATQTMSKRFANAVADYISHEMFPSHRGVIEIRNPFNARRCFVAFGNDGYSQDDRTQRYADKLVQCFAKPGEPDVELGLDSEDGYTWAIVLALDTDMTPEFMHQWMHDALYRAYLESRGLDDCNDFARSRAAICEGEIIQHTGGRPLTIPGWEAVN